jgi:hypothetical protein
MFGRSFKYMFLILALLALTCKKKVPETLEEKVIEKIHKLNGSNKAPESFAAPEGEPLYLYPPKIKLIKVSADTVYLRVINDFYLTQSMGTAGAEEYITESATSLLEIDGIHYVDFDFKMGDHACPGTYSKAGYNMREE